MYTLHYSTLEQYPLSTAPTQQTPRASNPPCIACMHSSLHTDMLRAGIQHLVKCVCSTVCYSNMQLKGGQQCSSTYPSPHCTGTPPHRLPDRRSSRGACQLGGNHHMQPSTQVVRPPPNRDANTHGHRTAPTCPLRLQATVMALHPAQPQHPQAAGRCMAAAMGGSRVG